jgi:membrane protein
MKTFLFFLKETLSEWRDDKALKLGAALSYYTVFSLPPLLVIVIALGSLIFSEEAVRQQIIGQIQSLVGEQSRQLIETMIAKTSAQKGSYVAAVIGVIVLLFGATGVFGELQDSLNMIWEVKRKPGAGIRTFFRTRLLSLSLVVAIAFLLLVSLVVSAALAAFSDYLKGYFGKGDLLVVLLYLLNFLISLAVITFLFALMFKVLPDAEIPWRNVWVGAFFTALLFTIGKFLIGLYLGKSGLSSTYGAAGSLVLILLWVFYSSQILFLGAEFTQVYSRRKGEEIVPQKQAMRVKTVEEVEKQISQKDS